MKHRRPAAFFLAAAALTACADGGTPSLDSAALETSDQKASYGIGMNLGGQLGPARNRLDRAAFMRGVEDGLQGNESAIPQAELQEVLMAFGNEMEAEAAAEQERESQENLAEGAAFLAENGARDEVTTTASGLQYEVLRAGDGPTPGQEGQVRLHYRGTLVDGTEFDSSYGGEPRVFGVGGLIDGFTEALMLMPAGSHYRVVIPPEIGYGPGGTGPIGPNSTLIFEIEVLEIVDGQ